VAFLAPAVLSLGVASVLSRLLPTPVGLVATIAWWAALLVGSGVALVLFDRLFRRLLPLSVLLNLALVFPGAAPSRFAAAIRGGSVRNLEARIEQAKSDAASAGIAEAAQTVVELVGALAAHDPRTRGHCERTRAFSDLIAEELGLSVDERDKLRWSALLHDIGKLHVEASLLNKPSRPDDEEWRVLRSHPIEGARVVGALATWLGPWALAIEQHHERFDGAGYPRGLAGHDISLAGRIVAVADAYEVMTAVRAYKRPMSAEAAREELVRCAGTHFDPHVVRALLRVSISRMPRAAAIAVPLLQLPGVVGLQRLLDGPGSVLVSMAAVAGVVTAGVVGPVADGGGGPGAPPRREVAAAMRPRSSVPAPTAEDPAAASAAAGAGAVAPADTVGEGAAVSGASSAPRRPSATRGPTGSDPAPSSAGTDPSPAPPEPSASPPEGSDPPPPPSSDPPPSDPPPPPPPPPSDPPAADVGIEVHTTPPLPVGDVAVRIVVDP
jgi:putative nucleotidyltransferase with HDIG domain